MTHDEAPLVIGHSALVILTPPLLELPCPVVPISPRMAWQSLRRKPVPATRNEEATGAGRRRSERKPYIIEGWLSRPNDPGDEIEVVALNVSHHGIGFKMPQPLNLGEFFTMEIGLGEQRMISEVRVVSCRACDGGMFDVGAEFC